MAVDNFQCQYDKIIVAHKTGFELCSRALSADEKRRTATGGGGSLRSLNELIKLYESACAALQTGCDIELLDETGTWAEKLERVRKKQEKMRANMVAVKERIKELQSGSTSCTERSELDSGTGSGPKSLHPAAANRGANARRSASALEKPDNKIITRRKGSAPPNVPSNKRTNNNKLPHRSKSPAVRSNGNRGAADLSTRIRHCKSIDPKMGHLIADLIIEKGASGVTFDDIIGLDSAKRALNEAIVWPSLNPELFTELRRPVKGILLFGPPGNGKTMLAKAVASECGSNFFNISSSALTSKWVGESEKLVKTLFSVARDMQPAVVFIDEIDSILCVRSGNENESSRRLKTEFMLQFDGVVSSADDRLLVMGATNRPHELDDAVIRRFAKRIHVPLPDLEARKTLIGSLLRKLRHSLTQYQVSSLASKTENFCNSDLTNLAAEAAMEPLRDLPPEKLKSVKNDELRPVSFVDFERALTSVRPSVNSALLGDLLDFSRKHGDLTAR